MPIKKKKRSNSRVSNNGIKKPVARKRNSEYDSMYLPADTEVVFHEGLKGLDVIRIKLPKPPKKYLIDNYGLPPLEQKFQRTELPPKLRLLNSRGYVDVQDYWNEIELDYEYYQPELWFIEQEWKRRRFGYWTYIKGKPTWIPPWHYMYLNYYSGLTNEKTGEPYPEYRDKDRRLFVGRWYAATTTEAPFKYKYYIPKSDNPPKYTNSEIHTKKMASKGYTVEQGFFLVDMGVRTLSGTVEFKGRRFGYTSQCTGIGAEIVTRMKKAKFGLQSMTEKKGAEIFEQQVVGGYKGYPFFFIPISENLVDPKKSMNFSPALKRSNTGGGTKQRITKALYSSMTYGSSTVGYFDGDKLKYWLSDEFGKCLKKWTPVLMYDGSIKFVQDVVVGDRLRGDDNEPRIVLSTNTGTEQMYDIVPNKGMTWGCNESHLLSLKRKEGKKETTITISVRDYLQLSEEEKSKLLQYRIGGTSPQRSRFKVVKKEVGEYFGFSITGNRLFLLGDHTVTHNTLEVDVLERTLVVRKTFSTGDNKIIHGYSNQISTAGDLKTGGGSDAKRLTQLSHWGRRNDLGQTGSGYINLFIPSEDGLEGYIDEWGGSMVEAAAEAIEAKRRTFTDEGKWAELNEEIRQSPRTWQENFISNNKQARFNAYILERRISELTSDGNKFVVHGRFAWEKNSTHGYDIKKLPSRHDFITKKDRVIFIPEDEGYHSWELSWIPDTGMQNRFTFSDDENKIILGNINKATHGADVFKYGEKTESGAGSLGGGAIFRLYDPTVDLPYLDPMGVNPETGDYNHVTNRFCGVYLKRPALEEYLEQQLMAALFFGIKTYPEMNLKDVYRWYKDRGFEEYLFYDVDLVTGKEKKEPGSHTTTNMINAIFNAYAQQIDQNGLREVHPAILQQCSEIDDSMSDYDLFAAGGYALIQAGASRVADVEDEGTTYDVSDIFQFERLD